MNLRGPYRVASVTGAEYFLTIVDDFSRHTWTFLLQSKFQVATVIKHFLAMVESGDSVQNSDHNG